ncbi:ATP-dependent RNA helicase RhlE [Klebsiella pneumoniae]|uniref:ATP-dependent RNA helicase RhlE n=1 Tax=Klebsiella pneumoniae TaxID=573 RepID=A0A378BH76_KLEPN|nr:ATP-dependent RNA helicase RhlE [Klebsiella pneumoniae]
MATRARERVPARWPTFKSGGIRVLVATDIAARGLDIEELPHVVNYELPNVPEDYVHRIGRTGRAAATGEALSLVCVDEHKLLRDIERLLKKEIPRIAIAGYEPDPSIKAEPIQNGRQQRGGGRGQGQGRGGQGQDAADSRAARIMPHAVRTARRRKRALRTAKPAAPPVARVNRLANNTLIPGRDNAPRLRPVCPLRGGGPFSFHYTICRAGFHTPQKAIPPGGQKWHNSGCLYSIQVFSWL